MSTQTEQERPESERPAADRPPAQDPGGGGSETDERAAYEAELSRLTSADMVFQAAVSLLNIGAYRMGLVGAGGPEADRSTAGQEGGPGPAQDLEQVRDAIDAVRGLLPVLERSAPQELRPLRDALSQLQLAYTRAAQTAGPRPPADASGEAAAERPIDQPPSRPSASERPVAKPEDRSESGQRRPGPAESTGRLWVPGR
jgi:hypothetical protein